MTLTATLCKMCMKCIVRFGILKSKKKRATFIFIFLSICKMSRVIVDQRRQVAEGENLDKLRGEGGQEQSCRQMARKGRMMEQPEFRKLGCWLGEHGRILDTNKHK